MGGFRLPLQWRHPGAAWLRLGTYSKTGEPPYSTGSKTLSNYTVQIDVLICTPSILSLKTPEEFPNIKVVATAGERSNQL